jgi:iron-sulfur cluster repair protein YtfE (RIC family)
MDIIEALKEDHKKVQAMFEQLEKTTTAASKTRVEVLAKLESDLRKHMKFEEDVLYPEIKAAANKEGRELTNEAYAEHEAALTTLTRLKEEQTSDEMWKACRAPHQGGGAGALRSPEVGSLG